METKKPPLVRRPFRIGISAFVFRVMKFYSRVRQCQVRAGLPGCAGFFYWFMVTFYARKGNRINDFQSY